MRSKHDRPWSEWAASRCLHCGRPVYPVWSGGRVHLLALLPVLGGYSFGPHACLPRGARYGAPAVREGPPLPSERAEFHI